MSYRSLCAAMIVVAATATSAVGATVLFIDNSSERYVDILYTPGAGVEFTNWDLIATPSVGSILDPIPSQRFFNTSAGNIPNDTFANTVFSAVGAGSAVFVYTEYNPGQAFPPIAADPVPTARAQPPAPDELNWSIFDTNTGDGAIPGFTPYHMARIVYSQGGSGIITARFFDTGNPGVGERFSTIYNFPEPTSAFMAGASLLSLAIVRRRRS